jgi:hypothetical protein
LPFFSRLPGGWKSAHGRRVEEASKADGREHMQGGWKKHARRLEENADLLFDYYTFSSFSAFCG